MVHFKEGQRNNGRERERGRPAALLTEPLLNATDDDLGGLGVHAADLVPRVVSLGVAQIHLTSLYLAPRRLDSLHRIPSTAGGSPAFLGGR